MKKSPLDAKSGQTVTQALDTVKTTHRHLLKAAGLVGLMTLASRILGMVRDIVSAGRFGTTWQWDAFVYAFMLPNFLRRIVAEGALSSAFIPVYSEIREKEGQERAFRFANTVMTLLGCGVLALLLLLEGIFALLLKGGLLPERIHFTVDLLRLMFPYLGFIVLYALGMGILNCHRRFFAASLGPVILDIVWIAGVIWIAPLAGALPQDQLRYLSFAILFSGLLQFAAEFPSLRQIRCRFRWIWDTADPYLKKAWNLLLPGMMSFAIVQINILVDMTLGMAIGAGANSSLWYGTRLMQFPLGVFAIAMGTALLPALSSQAANQDREAVRKTLSFALRSVFFIILPCTVGLIILRDPIIQLLFERGRFDAVSTLRTGRVLLCYSIGLFAFSGQKIISTGFYAAQDTRTPVVIGIAALMTNIVLNLILMQWMREAGLALATSLAGILQFFLLIYGYDRKTSDFPFRETVSSLGRVLAASLAMGAVCVFSYGRLTDHFMAGDLKDQLIRVSGSILISCAAYFVFCFLFRVREMKEAWAWMRGKHRPRSEADLPSPDLE